MWGYLSMLWFSYVQDKKEPFLYYIDEINLRIHNKLMGEQLAKAFTAPNEFFSYTCHKFPALANEYETILYDYLQVCQDVILLQLLAWQGKQ